MKTLYLLVLAFGLTIAPGCVNVSDFREPFMQEVFMGSLSFTPVVKGLTAGGRATSAVTVMGNKTGETVSIFGLPKNEPFDIIPPQFDPTSPPINVSGFEAEVVDKVTLKITGFSSISGGAEELGLEVSGTLIRSGPRLSTSPNDPIIIRGKAGSILEHFPAALKDRIVEVGGTPITQIADDEMVDLYQIKFAGQLTSIF